MRLRQFLRRRWSDVTGWSRFAAAATVVVTLVVSLGYCVCSYAWPAFAGHPYFRLRSVGIACDTDAASPALLASRAGLYDGTSLWSVNVEAAEQALESASWVRSADVFRRFPDHIDIRVHRREPVAATLTGRGPFLIDADGVVYREEGRMSYPDVPWVSGWDHGESRGERVLRLRKAVALVSAAQAEGMMVSEVHLDADGVVWAFPESHTVSVRLGKDFDALTSVRRLRAVLATLPAKEVELKYIDLTYADRAVVRTAKGRVSRTIAAVARLQAATRYSDAARLSQAGEVRGGEKRG